MTDSHQTVIKSEDRNIKLISYMSEITSSGQFYIDFNDLQRFQ